MTTVTFAASVKDAAQALVLVSQRYEEMKYIPRGLGSMTTLVGLGVAFVGSLMTAKKYVAVAKNERRVIGTISMQYNSVPKGVADMYPEIVKDMKGSLYAYVGGFAVYAAYSCRLVGLRLIRHLLAKARKDGIEQALCLVNPRHVSVYEALGFKVAGPAMHMQGLSEEAVAVPLTVRLSEIVRF